MPDLSGLSERGNRILEMLETAEVNKYESADSTITKAYEQGKISKNDAKIMRDYYRIYADSE